MMKSQRQIDDHGERIVRVEEGIKTVMEDVTDMRIDLKSIADNVSLIRINLAKQSGAAIAVRYTGHILSGAFGGLMAWIGFHR